MDPRAVELLEVPEFAELGQPEEVDMSKSKTIIRILALLSLIVWLSACVVAGPPRNTYMYPPVTYVEWYYYPDYEVYYHPVEHYYYYAIGGVWRRSTQLPSGWVLSGQRRVRVGFNGDPSGNHDNQRRRFPPGQAFQPPTGRPDHDHDRQPQHRPGNGEDNERRPGKDRKENPDMFFPHLKDAKSKEDQRPQKSERGEHVDERPEKASKYLPEYRESTVVEQGAGTEVKKSEKQESGDREKKREYKNEKQARSKESRSERDKDQDAKERGQKPDDRDDAYDDKRKNEKLNRYLR